MATKIYWIHQFPNSAKVGIMARPRGEDWLEDEILSFKKQNVNIVVSLLEANEISELGLNEQKSICAKHEIKYYNFPIADRNIPGKRSETDSFILKLFNELQNGSNIIIHCRMGIGRASIIAGSILLLDGQKAEDIISSITKIRGLKVPDTDEQFQWLKSKE